jgi:selenium-binding protein 1
MKAPRELLLYTVALYIGTGIQKPDYLATIDADPNSPTYSQVISRLLTTSLSSAAVARRRH